MKLLQEVFQAYCVGGSLDAQAWEIFCTDCRSIAICAGSSAN